MMQAFLLAECLVSRHYPQKLKQEELGKLVHFVQIVVGPCKETSLELAHGVTCCLTSVLSPDFFFFQEFQQLKKQKQKTLPNKTRHKEVI